jgi:nitroreductase
MEEEHMDIMETIDTRKSVRAFKADPVPKVTLEAIMKAALRAPSWGNSQPWEFAVLGGEMMGKVKGAMLDKAQSGVPPNPDVASPTFEDPHRDRMRRGGQRLFEQMGIAREDKEARQNWMLGMYRFFDAPHVVVVYVDAYLSQWALLDVGLTLENLMLAAWHFGVGTCAEAAAAQYPDVLRDFLNIPESKRIVVGVALGYPDMSKSVMNYRSEREPLETMVAWHGCD